MEMKINEISFKKMKYVLHGSNERPILVIYITKSNFDTKYPNNIFSHK